MKHKILLGIVILMFSSLFGCRNNYQERRDSELVDELNFATAKKLYEQQGLLQIGHSAQMMTDIERLGLSFQYFHEVDENEARKLLFAAAREYLAAINGNEEIQQYLHNRPFTLDNVEISIFFQKPDRSTVLAPKISVAEAEGNEFRYFVKNRETDLLKPLLKETYQEALQRSGHH